MSGDYLVLITVNILSLQGDGDAAIAVWTRQQHSGITLADFISSYILGGLQSTVINFSYSIT